MQNKFNKNPLFDKLLERASSYKYILSDLNEQEIPPVKNTELYSAGESENLLAEIVLGAYLVLNSAIFSFPSGKYKSSFSEKYGRGIQGMTKDGDSKSILDQISSLFDEFMSGAVNDDGIKDLEEAYKDFKKSISEYKKALQQLISEDGEKFKDESIRKIIRDKIANVVAKTGETLKEKEKTNESILFLLESKEDRREKRFEKRGNLQAFIKNCDSLASQITSGLDKIRTNIILSPKSKSPAKYEDIYVELLHRINELIKDVKNTKDAEGKKIKDADLIKKYLDLYDEIKLDLQEKTKNFNEEYKGERMKYLKSLKYSKVTDVISSAMDFKNSAEKIITNINKTNARIDGEEGQIKTDFKIDAPIKKAEVFGKFNDNVQKFQKILISKFSGYKPVADSEVFKKFIKYGADGKFGPSTASVIQGIKAGFELADKTSDITQEIIDKIKTESLTESITTFEEFEKIYKSINEKFDPSAYNNVVKSSKTIKPSEASSAMKGAALDKKIPADVIKKAIEDNAKQLTSEWNKEQAIKDLQSIGAVKNEEYDGKTQMAIAKSQGYRFYQNGTALRLFDRMMGMYDIKKDEFHGDDKSVDKLSRVSKDFVPDKYVKICTDLYNDIYYTVGMGGRNTKLYQNLLKKTADEIKIIATGYKLIAAKYNKSTTLYKDLDNEIGSPEIDKLIGKFEAQLK